MCVKYFLFSVVSENGCGFFVFVIYRKKFIGKLSTGQCAKIDEISVGGALLSNAFHQCPRTLKIQPQQFGSAWIT